MQHKLAKGYSMKTSVIITGACGRMGKTLIDVVSKDAACQLVGVLEREAMLPALHAGMQGCAISACAETLLSAYTNAVIIDFTAPEASLDLARVAAKYGNPLVIGTTGLTVEQKAELETLARKTPIFWASNMSIGVNVLMQILPELVRMLGEEYDMEMVELHHNRKKDSPSGTALSLAQCLAAARGWDLADVGCYHREGMIGERPHKEIGVQTIRGGDVVGVHTMYFMGPGERIEVTHHAHSRETFAQGAVRAAKWLVQQQPNKLYGMKDIF